MKEFKVSRQSELTANKLLSGSTLLEKCGMQLISWETAKLRRARKMFEATDMELCLRDWTQYNFRATRRPGE